jgi:DNA helicase-2/ATP-dependent DNA helicase PcrA
MEKYNQADDHIDGLLESYVSFTDPKSFFLNAGAGAGKTYSLINLMVNINKKYGTYLRKTNRKVAVITYTKVASEEIISRIPGITSFDTSTIHSYLWNLIKGYDQNIKEALIHFCDAKIYDYNSKEKLNKKQQQELDSLEYKKSEIKKTQKFYYAPNSIIESKNTLSHSEVLQVFSFLIDSNELFREIVYSKYPIILIDECQDTNKEVLDAFIKLSKEKKICIGLFGDAMQRVYMDGKSNLIKALDEFEVAEKKVNWRSYGRIVEFTNILRESVDNLKQEVCTDNRKEKGLLRICLIDHNSSRKMIEEDISSNIQEQVISNNVDIEYNPYKLVLEHTFAAERNNFLNLFTAFKSSEDTKNIMSNDELSEEYRFFKKLVVPLYKSWQANDDFNLHRLLKKHSCRFDELNQYNSGAYKILNEIGQDFKELLDTFNDEMTIGNLCESIIKSKLFEVPAKLKEDFEEETGWKSSFEINFKELIEFYDYHDGYLKIITQQGSKGLEYDHVQVVIDDYNARGRSFSYEKLFGVKEKSATDINNESQGKDTTLHKTNRVFYVACSRAIKSLVLIIYTSDQQKVKKYFLDNRLVNEEEILIM